VSEYQILLIQAKSHLPPYLPLKLWGGWLLPFAARLRGGRYVLLRGPAFMAFAALVLFFGLALLLSSGKNPLGLLRRRHSSRSASNTCLSWARG